MEIWKVHVLGGSDIFKLGLYENRPTGNEKKMAPEGKFVTINKMSCRRLYIRNMRKTPAQPVDRTEQRLCMEYVAVPLKGIPNEQVRKRVGRRRRAVTNPWSVRSDLGKFACFGAFLVPSQNIFDIFLCIFVNIYSE